MFGEVGFLSETFTAQRACKWFFAGVSSYVYVNRIFIFETLRANGAIVKRPFLTLSITWRRTVIVANYNIIVVAIAGIVIVVISVIVVVDVIIIVIIVVIIVCNFLVLFR